MESIAAAVVLVCLVALVGDFSRRWGRPRRQIDPRSRLTYGLVAALVVAIVTINIID